MKRMILTLALVGTMTAMTAPAFAGKKHHHHHHGWHRWHHVWYPPVHSCKYYWFKWHNAHSWKWRHYWKEKYYDCKY